MKELHLRLLSIALLLTLSLPLKASSDQLKPRIVVLTDIAPGETEPDDMGSMVRLLAHADLYEIEALITTSGWNNSGRAYPIQWQQFLYTTIDAYEKDLPNLMKRSNQTEFKPLKEEIQKQKLGYWPSAQYLRSRVFSGSQYLGVEHLGEKNDSPGSNFIIELAKEKDPRPLWILVWGGGNTIAQSLWKIKNNQNDIALDNILKKIRIYTITDQDVDWGRRGQYALSSHLWMRETFGDKLFFIWDESAWLSQNSIGASHWQDYKQHIQGKGHLGSVYPKYKYGVEGDTPSFLYVTPSGLNDPENPTQISWGGFFQKTKSADGKTICYTNTPQGTKKISQKYENYFYPAIFNNFAARMAWAQDGKGNHNPVAIINRKKGLKPIVIHAKENKRITLNASKSYDPDGDEIEIKWHFLPECSDPILETPVIETDKTTAHVTLPVHSKGKQIHILCEITDHGDFNLKSYRRVIINIK